MKLIIDISKGAYDSVVDGHLDQCIKYFANAISKGTPLPKGYGRLIDADALKKSNEEYIIAYPMDEEECMRNTMVRWINDDITDAPTIIEADTESEDKE